MSDELQQIEFGIIEIECIRPPAFMFDYGRSSAGSMQERHPIPQPRSSFHNPVARYMKRQMIATIFRCFCFCSPDGQRAIPCLHAKRLVVF